MTDNGSINVPAESVDRIPRPTTLITKKTCLDENERRQKQITGCQREGEERERSRWGRKTGLGECK
jgi:hypothetical protein